MSLQTDDELWQEQQNENLAEELDNDTIKETKYVLTREAKILRAKVEINQPARTYYKQMRLALEDMLALEMAQQAVTSSLKAETFNSAFEVTDKSLVSFTTEMEKIKSLKLLNALLPLASIPMEQEVAILETISKLYGQGIPSGKSKENKNSFTLQELETILKRYVDSIVSKTTPKSSKKEKL